jgi:uncharacterized protein YbcI
MKTQRARTVARSDRLGVEETGHLAWKEIESALCEEIMRFQQECMGRRPQKVHTHLIGDILLVRLQGVLTAAERELAQASGGQGVILLKHLRDTLVETTRPLIEAIVAKVAGAQVLSLHHDISTVTGEEVLVFTLGEALEFA